VTRYVNPGAEVAHIWPEDCADWIEPETGEDYGDSIGETLCGQMEPGYHLARLRDAYPSLHSYTKDRRACPECVAILAERHNLPDGHLHRQARQAREEMDATRRFGVTEGLSIDGMPVIASEDVEGVEVKNDVEPRSFTGSLEDFTIEVEMDLELETEAIEKMAEQMAEEAKQMSPSLHPMTSMDIRETSLVREDGTPITFTGTCVQTSPEVVLDNGEAVAEVTDTSVLGEDARLGREYEVPAQSFEIREVED